MTNFGKLVDGPSGLAGQVEGATPIPRTQDELLERFKASDDFFGFGRETLLPFLDFEMVKGQLKAEYVEQVEEGTATWTQYPATKELVLACAEEYMQFAWGKAMDHRGISASRSLVKISTYLWMVGDDDAVEVLMDDANYYPYGVPALRKVCEDYGWPMPDREEVVASDAANQGTGTVGRMMDGEACVAGCRGCGG